MRWTPGDRGDIEDMRGRSGFGGTAVPLGLGGFIVLLLLSWVSGTNLFTLLGTDTQSPAGSAGTTGQVQTSPAEERLVDFVDAVTKDAQDMWAEKLGGRYERTRVVLFRDAIESACGLAQSATGPFYCPPDRKVYLDLGFFDELSRRFGAPGDFAQAYVITHELGHHVQNLLGLSNRAEQDRRAGPNSASVALELQADCFAGVWAHNATNTGYIVGLGSSDIADALDAAAAVGDDRIQSETQGQVSPETWTHGSAAQRQRWFTVGYRKRLPTACNTCKGNL